MLIQSHSWGQIVTEIIEDKGEKMHEKKCKKLAIVGTATHG
jgi:hypothetical protein